MMDKAAEKQISVGFLDPDFFTSTNISQRSQQDGKAISNAMMNNYYVVDSYCTSHLVIVIICMKFKEVWYLDSAKQHPLLKFPDLQHVLNWSVSCRFCSQKLNLLVFLIGIADHAVPLVQYFLFTKNQSLSVSIWYC
jgi:type II secretory pathway component PulF